MKSKEADKTSDVEHEAWKTCIPCRKVSSNVRDDLPVEHVGIVSFLLYGWLDTLMWQAYRHPASSLCRIKQRRGEGANLLSGSCSSAEDVIWNCPQIDSAAPNAERLEKLWLEEINAAAAATDNRIAAGAPGTAAAAKEASLKRVFLKFIRKRCLIGVLSQVLAAFFLLFSAAYVMRRILITSSHSHDDSTVAGGIVLVLALFICNMLSAIFFIATVTIMQIAGGRLRSGMLLMLYRRILRIPSLKEDSIGEILNLCANDGQRIFEGVTMLPVAVSAPLLVIGSTGYALWLLGPWALIGLAVLLVLLPLQGIAGKLFMKFRGAAILVTDKRVKIMTEYLANIRFIKMYSWESSVTKIVKGIRKAERKLLEKVNLAMSYMMMTTGFLVAIATILTLIAYTASGNHLSPDQAFLYILIYTCIQDKLELCMLCVKLISELFVAAMRFQKLLIQTDPLLRAKYGDNYKFAYS